MGISSTPVSYCRTIDQRLNSCLLFIFIFYQFILLLLINKIFAVIGLLNHVTIHYSLGMRCYYVAIPVAIWIFGITSYLNYSYLNYFFYYFTLIVII